MYSLVLPYVPFACVTKWSWLLVLPVHPSVHASTHGLTSLLDKHMYYKYILNRSNYIFVFVVSSFVHSITRYI